MSFDKKQLKDATAFLREAYESSLSEPSQAQPQYSPDFLQKMEKLGRCYRKQKVVKSITKYVAILLVALMLTGGLFLSLNTEARAIFQAWYRSISAERYTYRFTENRRGQPLPDYEITWLPEGYYHSKTRRYENTTLVGYKKEDPKSRYIIPMGLEYFWISDQIAMAMPIGDYGGHTITEQSITVNGNPAYLYEDINRWNNTRSYDLVWVDQDAGLVFRLGTSLSVEETIAVAESIRTVK